MPNPKNQDVTEKRTPAGRNPGRDEQSALLIDQIDGEYFRDLVNNAAQGICIHQDERIVYANPAYAKMHGYELSEILGGSVADLICDQDAAEFGKRNADRLAGKVNAEQYEIRGKRKDGSVVWLGVSARVTCWSGRPATQEALLDIGPLKLVEQRLTEGEQRFKDFAESSSDYYWEMGPDLRFSYFSDRFFEKFPLAPEQILGKSREDLIGETIDENARAHLEDLNNRKPFRRFEYRANLGGRAVFASISGVPMFNTDGEFLGYRGTGTEITERKEAEEALTASAASARESKRHLSAMMNAVPDAVVTIDAENVIQSFNPAAERIFGYTAAEAVGQEARILMPEEAHARHKEGLNRFLQTGESKIIGKRREVVAQRKDGSTFPLEIALNWMEIPQGLMFIGVCQDITERKKAEEALTASEANTRESKHRLSAMMNAVPDAVITIDAENIIQSFNPAAERMFGYSAAEAVGQKARILMPEEAHVRHKEGLSRFLQTGESKIIGKRHEVTAQRRDGSTLAVEIAINWMEIPQGLMFVGVCQDITERKKAEQEKAELEQTLQQSYKMEAIGTLAGGIAHDINNTLVPILGLVELMQLDAEPDDENFDSLEVIRTATERIKELVGQILTFSRKEDEQNKVIEIGTAVDETIPLLRSTIPSTIEIRSDIDMNAGLVVIGPAQVHQIVLNLATNASLAMEDGGVLKIATKRIELDQESADHNKDLNVEPGSYALVSVSDTGSGMDEGTLAKIFDPFFTTRGVGEGTGMGLSVVHGIVAACGGAVTVSSGVGKGTTFELYFPVVANGQSQRRQEEAIPAEEMAQISQASA